MILQKVLVNYFYRMNAGFFAFFFFVLFGVVKGGQLINYHLSLMQAFLGSGILLSIVIGIWGLYTLKCANYIIRRLLEPQQLFLSTLNQLSTNKIRGWMLFIHVQVYAPVWIYACIAIGVAIHNGLYQSAFIILIANSAFMALAVEWYTSCLRNHGSKIILMQWELPKVPFIKLAFSYPLWHLWKERKQMMVLTKLFTLVFLYGFIQLYEPYRPDQRPLLLCFLLIVAAHSTIITQIRTFEYDSLLFMRSLPISMPNRFLKMMLLYLILFIPELIYVWKAYPIHFSWIDYPQLVWMVLVIPSFFHSIQYTHQMKPEEYLNIVFVVMAVLFFMIIYSLTFWLLSLMILLAYVFFHFHFFEFEKNYQNKGGKA